MESTWVLSALDGPHVGPMSLAVRDMHPFHANGNSMKLECGTWYHHPRRLQCVLSRNLRIVKVPTWHYRCRHNLKNNCIWDNMCLLVPRSSSKPVMLTIDLQSRNVLFIEIVFGMYNLERQLSYWHLLTRHCPCNLLPESTSSKHEYREKLWGHPVTSLMTPSPLKFFFGIIWDDLIIWEVRLKLCLIFNFFLKWPPFWARDKRFLPKFHNGSWIYQNDSHEHFWHFEYFIVAVAQILTGDISISKFELCYYLVTSSITAWIYIYIIVVISSWYLCTGSLMMISLLVFKLSWKKLLFHL